MPTAVPRDLEPFAHWLRHHFQVPDLGAVDGGHPNPQPTFLFRQHVTDFTVHETLSFEPAGEGPHWFIQVEKTGLSTNHLLQRLSEHWALPRKEIGFAGRKDQRGVTTQWVSVPAHRLDEARLASINLPDVKLLQVKRNTKKLRLGQVRCNRFQILLRGSKTDRSAVTDLWNEAVRHGVPNFFGHQRFGFDAGNLEKVLQFMTRTKKARSVKEKFLVSVFQSICFNHWLKERLKADRLTVPMTGDVLLGLPFGQRPFHSEGLEATAQRLAEGAVTVAGPLPGPKAMGAERDALVFEHRCWEQMGLSATWMQAQAYLEPGARRPSTVPLLEPKMRWSDEGLELHFGLPKGSYATSVLQFLLPGQIEDVALRGNDGRPDRSKLPDASSSRS